MGKIKNNDASKIKKESRSRLSVREADRKIKNHYKELINMYDYLIANIIKGSSIVEPSYDLGNDNLDIGYDSVGSSTHMSKYYIVSEFPTWMKPSIMHDIRNKCLKDGVKINFFMYSSPHKINWDSDAIKNKLSIWKHSKEASQQEEYNTTVFDHNYRSKRAAMLNRIKIYKSVQYLNKAELEFGRSLCEISMVIQISGKRGYEGQYLYNMSESISKLKTYASSNELKLRELRVNLADWLRVLNPLSLRYVKEVTPRIPKRVVTDDNFANMNNYSQGRIGGFGIPLGFDVETGMIVTRDFFKDKASAENWLIAAYTGGGKSYFITHLVTWLLLVNIVVTIIDFEGDEHTVTAKYIGANKHEDAVIVSLGGIGSGYCDPMRIPSLTGNIDIDSTLKEEAIKNTMSTFAVIISDGKGNVLNKWQRAILSDCIKEVNDNAGITDDPSTWKNSEAENITILEVFNEIRSAVIRKKYADDVTDNLKHKTAVEMYESCVPYFVEGEAYYGVFSNPISMDRLYKAKLIVFSYGEKGKATSAGDLTLLQLKQLTVANLSTQISNYQKYVKNTINAKVWEEGNRYLEVDGSLDILNNTYTGGRKRGDFNIFCTNNLDKLMEDGDSRIESIRGNFTSYCVGKLPDKDTINKFCKKLGMQNLKEDLFKISGATEAKDRKYFRAFCINIGGIDKAVVKVVLPKDIGKSKLYKKSDRIRTE